MLPDQPEGFLAIPSSGKGPGVLVLHAWWGLNDTIKTFCTRLADAGFVAFAPDLYHGKVAETIPDAEALANTLGDAYLEANAKVLEAAAFLNDRSEQNGHGLAVIGFSLGAYFALELSNADPEHIRAVVVFYGTGVGDFSHAKAAYLCHFAENDAYEPQAGIDGLAEALRLADRPVTFHHYDGTGHWFFEPDRTDAYNEDAANLAWTRTLAFLKRSEVVNDLQEKYQQWLAMLHEAGPEGMEQPGVIDHWSLKDTAAHLTGWLLRTVARLQAGQRNEPIQPPHWPTHLETVDAINAWIYETNHSRSLRDVLDDSQHVFDQLIATIEGLPDAFLIDPMHYYPWLDDQPFDANELMEHFDEHDPEIRAWLAQLDDA